MDYITNIIWHTEFPKVPGYPDKPEDVIFEAGPSVTPCMLLVKTWNDYGQRWIKLYPSACINPDGSWDIIDGDVHPLADTLGPFQVMAWGERPISGETVAALCDASNRDNYGITERDYTPSWF